MTKVAFTVNPHSYTGAQKFAFLFIGLMENLNNKRPTAFDMKNLSPGSALRHFVIDNSKNPHIDDFWHMACKLRDEGFIKAWPSFTSHGIVEITSAGIVFLKSYAPAMMKSFESLSLKAKPTFCPCGRCRSYTKNVQEHAYEALANSATQCACHDRYEFTSACATAHFESKPKCLFCCEICKKQNSASKLPF